jgi:arylsulfatase A-like enzyme
MMGCGASEPGPPNVILVSLDTLRADHLGVYGYERPTSPRIDDLARESLVFDRAVAPASATQPSHRSFYQSRIASHTRRRLPMLPEVFREHGYRTAGFTGNGNVSRKFGFARGYEVYEEDPEGFSLSYPKLEKWLRANADSPFFVFFHSFDIHHPYASPAPFEQTFMPEYRGPVTGWGTLDILSKIRRIAPNPDFEGEVRLRPVDRAKIVALYDGGILHADHVVGRLVDLLQAIGAWENTILILFSDHGEEFWEHDNVTHAHTVYDEVLHIPLIWRLPRDAYAGLRIAAPVHLMDVAPTLLELVGLPVPDTFMGQSLLPFEGLDARLASSRSEGAIVSEMYTLKSLIEWPWKVIKEYPDGKRRLASEPLVLYDLEDDPGETRNLASAHPDVARRLEARLEAALSLEENRQVRDVPAVVEDEELRRRLEALGYVVGDPEAAAEENPGPGPSEAPDAN